MLKAVVVLSSAAHKVAFAIASRTAAISRSDAAGNLNVMSLNALQGQACLRISLNLFDTIKNRPDAREP